MRCSDCIEWIAQKLEGTLPEDRIEALERHLSRCNRCRAELLLQRKIRNALAQEPSTELSMDFTQRVSEKALEIAQIEKRTPVWPVLVPAFALAAATAVFFFLGADLFRELPSLAEPITEALSVVAVWIGDILLEVLTHAGGILRECTYGLQRLPQPLTNALVAALLAGLPAIWSIHRVSAFLRG